MQTALTDAHGEKDVGNAHGGLASAVRQLLLADVVESPARRNRDRARPTDGRDEADGAEGALGRLDERPPDA